jgi:drug/metabolite transporter (DMT)-like permease
MNDERLHQLLAAYKVPDAGAEQIRLMCGKAETARTRRIPTRSFSLLTQMRVQAMYISKWFYIACGSLAILYIAISAAMSMKNNAALFFGISPLFILPCAAVFYRTVTNGMLELEASSKYRMEKLFMGKLFLLGAVVSLLLSVSGIMSGLLFGSAIRSALLAFVSFTATAAIMLWFGKRRARRGFACGMVWGVMSIAFVIWDRSRLFLETASLLFVSLIFLIAVGFVFLAAIRFAKNISFEGVREEWNSLLTA